MRTWFTKANTQMSPDLANGDLAIMNRAGRMLAGNRGTLDRGMLSEIRMQYRRGMSAQDVVDEIRGRS